MNTDKKDEALKLAQKWYDSGNEDPDEFTEMIKQVIALAESALERMAKNERELGLDYMVQPAQDKEPCGWRMKYNGEWAYSFTEDAWDFIRRVPKAQQQEPVAYASDVEFDDETEIIPAEQKGKLGTAGLRIPLYIEPLASKPWVGLTDEEIEQVCVPLGAAMLSFTEVARAIEAKLKEKNA